MQNPPNILFIMADQFAAAAAPFLGNTAVKAPHLQALAQRSTIFENAYCSFPLCAPARASLMAGKFASQIGVFDNAAEFPASIPTVCHYLAAEGYRTILSGKMHFVGPDQLHGYHERLTTDIYPADFGWTPDWTAEYKPGHDLSTLQDTGACLRSIQLDYDETTHARAIQKLYDLARQPDGPFFLTVSYSHPHPPFHILQEYLDRYDPAEIDMPQVPNIDYASMDPMSQWVQAAHGLDKGNLTQDEVRRAKHAYYAMISYVDDKVGELLSALKDAGFADNTVVIFTSDHGEMMGERGMWFKRGFQEGSVRVPLLISEAGQHRTRRVVGNVSHLDLLPTFVRYARLKAADPVWALPLDGSALQPMMTDGGEEAPRTVIAEYTAESVLAPCFMVRRGPYKLIYTHGHPDQLFDLASDPHELRNIASDHAELVEELRAALFSKLDPELTEEAVLRSQASRRLINDLPDSLQATWDFQPQDREAQRYVRRGNPRVVKLAQKWPH